MAQALIGLSALPPHPVPWVRVIVILTQNVQTLSYAGRTTVETSTQELNLLQIVVFYPVRISIVAIIGLGPGEFGLVHLPHTHFYATSQGPGKLIFKMITFSK